MSSPESNLRASDTGSAPHGLQRRELLTLISALMALMALGIDIILPAFDDIRSTFGLSDSGGQERQIITIYFIGLAIAQLFFGPLSDWFGRKPVLYIGISIYLIGAIGSALAPSFSLLMTARFVWGIGAAGPRVVAVAIIRDSFEGNRMAKAMSEIMAVFVLVPIVAPALGAGIIAIFPWQGIFWFCVIWAVAIGAWSLRLSETLNPAYRTKVNLKTTLRGYKRVCTTRIPATYTVASIFLQAIFVLYLSASEQMISDILGRGGQFPFIFGMVAILFGITSLLNGQFVMIFGIQKILFWASLFLVLTSAALLIVTVTADGVPHFWAFIPILAIMLATFMFMMPNLNSAALFPLPDIAGTASALTSAIRMFFGALIGGLITTQVDTSLTPFTIGVLCLTTATAITVILAGDPMPKEEI